MQYVQKLAICLMYVGAYYWLWLSGCVSVLLKLERGEGDR